MAKKICRVLVVEDDDYIQQLLAEAFVDEGYRFAAAGNAEELRRALAVGDVDIVVIDVMLPGTATGIELAEEVAAQGYAVILITGHPARSEAIRQSGHRFLFKPFRLKALVDLVDQVLRETRASCMVGRHKVRATG